jgi:hypothetical protein
MNLFSSQVAKFPVFAGLLNRDLRLFVQANPTVFKALVSHGMHPGPYDLRVWASAASLRTSAMPEREQRRLVLRALGARTDPQVMLMTYATAGGSSDWLGSYNPVIDYITIYRPLIERWEYLETNRRTLTRTEEGYRIILSRNTIALLLHELVHFLNDQVFPKQPVNTEPNHLSRFGPDAFRPLGWEAADYDPFQEVLTDAGVKF